MRYTRPASTAGTDPLVVLLRGIAGSSATWERVPRLATHHTVIAPLIPVGHAHRAHQIIPESRLEIFAGAGHYPYLDDPERFAAILLDFIQATAPRDVSANPLRSRLKAGSRPPGAV